MVVCVCGILLFFWSLENLLELWEQPKAAEDSRCQGDRGFMGASWDSGAGGPTWDSGLVQETPVAAKSTWGHLSWQVQG